MLLCKLQIEPQLNLGVFCVFAHRTQIYNKHKQNALINLCALLFCGKNCDFLYFSFFSFLSFFFFFFVFFFLFFLIFEKYDAVGKTAGLLIYWQNTDCCLVIPSGTVAIVQLYQHQIDERQASLKAPLLCR